MLSKFSRDRRGAAAVEMALIAPAVAVLVLTAYNTWEAASREEDMRTALKTGALYYMSGGSSDTTAQSTVVSAWQNAPPGAAVTITRSYYCGGTYEGTTSVTCSSGSYLGTYVTITATATSSTAVVNPTLTQTKVIRVS